MLIGAQTSMGVTIFEAFQCGTIDTLGKRHFYWPKVNDALLLYLFVEKIVLSFFGEA